MNQYDTSGEDRFVGGTLQLLAWAQRNTRALVLTIMAAAIVIFAVKYYFDYKTKVREAAATEMVNLRFQLQSGTTDQIVEQLRAYLIQFNGTTYAQEARVLLAHTLLQANRAAEAIEPARQAMENLGNDILSLRAAFLAAAAYEEVADTAGAIGIYRRIEQETDSRVQRARALEAMGLLMAASGDAAGAASVYDELVKSAPEDSPARPFYEMRAAEYRARASGALARQVEEQGVAEGG